MVIASNEWLNNYEDEQKSASVNTTSTTTNTNNTPATSSTSGSTAAVNTVNTVSTATTTTETSATSTPTSTSTTPRTESEAIASTPTADNNINNSQTVVQQAEHQQQPHSMINDNKAQMMDESLKIDQETNEIENNNKDSASSTSKNNSPTSQSNSNTSLQTIVSNSTTNLTTNINSNTSNTAIANQQNTTNIATPIFNHNPITQQALSSAIQSALNSTSNNVTVSVNLPNSFITSLGGVGISPNATLQHTANLAKQLSSSLCALESHTNSNNFKSKLLDNNADQSMREYQQTTDNNGHAKIVLQCEPNSHPFQTRTILLTPNIECKVGRLIAKSKASESNAIFDCKVLSRNHAVLWYSNEGKFWVKDTSSSNGTFINESKLGTEASELHFGDVVKFGVDVMENSRKEVHGCIIAGVKLYLPDGRETISIESSVNHLSPHSGEGRISFDELHRLNLYMQEASQREKVLKSKLFNIQNILDATRKNSALCWQSMIAEDQLLHRIHSLEKKLQLMEKNVPENVLRNEVLKLIDDKNSYQHSAKEALRKVYQERCDAMQMLSKMESAVTASDNECKILRDQIMNTKQSLQDVNSRLLSLETEYNDFKGQNDRQQQEAREVSDQQAAELAEKLLQRESECELLKRKISELLLKRADLLDEEQLQKQAIEKLDAAIADMDLGDDDDEDEDDDDDDDDDVDDENDNEHNDEQHEAAKAELASETNKAHALNGKNAKVAQSQSSSDEEKTNSTKLIEESHDSAKRTGGQKSTILKWLENSDLNKKEGSLDIFDAICNESDSSDDSDNGAGTNEAKNNNKLSTTTDENKVENFEMQYLNFNNKLHTVQQNLSKLEAEIASKSNEKSNDIAAALGDISSTVIVEEEDEDESDDDVDDDSEISAEDEQHNEIISKRNAKKSAALLLHSKDNKSYTLLKNSVIMLREAYNEICLNMQQQKAKQPTKSPAISVQTQFQKYAQHKVSKSASKRVLAAQATLKAASESEENDDDSAASVDDNDDVVSGDGTARLSVASLQTIEEAFNARDTTPQLEQTADRSFNVNREKQKQQQLEATIKLYQKQIEELQAKLDLNENDAQNTLEIMQIECDAYKDKVEELNKIVETLSDEKQALQQVINENKSNAQKTAELCKDKLEVITEQLPVPHENVRPSESQELLAAHDNQPGLGTETKANTFEQEKREEQNEPQKLVATLESGSQANMFELEMREELAAINNASVQREEELIMYKERLEQTQSDNLRLRDEIADLVLKSNDYTKTMLKRMAPYGAVVVAILVYFIITYF